jgi:hypothetical protein
VFEPKNLIAGLHALDPETAMFELARRIQAEDKKEWKNPEYEAAIHLLEQIAKRNKQSNILKTRFKEIDGAHIYLGETTARILSILAPVVKAKREKEAEEGYKKKIEEELNRPKYGYAVLTSEEKARCHELLNQVRDTIQKSDLEIEKKNAISAQLNELSGEIDKDITPVKGFAALAGDFFITYNTLIGVAEPAIEATRRLVRIVFARSAEDQGLQLPAPNQAPMLEAKEPRAEG